MSKKIQFLGFHCVPICLRIVLLSFVLILIFNGLGNCYQPYMFHGGDLLKKTTAELRILRNEVYARRGYVFSSKDLKEYFEKQSWYKANPDFDPDHQFDEAEFEFLRRVGDKEREFSSGYPHWMTEWPIPYKWEDPWATFRGGLNNLIFAKGYQGVEIVTRDQRSGEYVGLAKDEMPLWGFSFAESEVWGQYAVARDMNWLSSQVFCREKDGIYFYDYKGCSKKKESVRIAEVSGECPPLRMALDMYNRPHIVYYDNQKKELQYSFREGRPWEGRKWSTTRIDSVPHAIEMMAIRVDMLGRPHVLYNEPSSRELKYALLGGEAAMTEVVSRDLVADAGVSMALDSNGIPHILYSDLGKKALWYSSREGEKWSKYRVASSTYAGYHNSIVVSSQSIVEIAYYDPKCKCLKFAERKNGKWETSIVDNSGDAGQYVDMTLDRNGIPHIAYYDAERNNLKYAALIPSREHRAGLVRKTIPNPGGRGGTALMLPLNDIWPPATTLVFHGREYSSDSQNARFISGETYMGFSSDDSNPKCGDVSGVAVTYYAVNTEIDSCVDKDYRIFLLNRKHLWGVGSSVGPGDAPKISTAGYCGPFGGVFPLPEGKHRLTYLAADNLGNYGLKETAQISVDATAPRTTVSVRGGELMNGVYKAGPEAVVELSAIDPEKNGVSSGLRNIRFSVVTTAEYKEDAYQGEHEVDEMDVEGVGVYDGPIKLTTGEYVVSYSAIDNVGNAEPRQEIKVGVTEK